MDKKYCIFDMDGTLTDSMSYWNALGEDFLKQHRMTPPDGLFDRMKVAPLLETARFFVEDMGVSGPPERVVAQFNGIMEEHYRKDVPLKPGVEDYLRRLRASGAHLAVASATALPLVQACLTRLGIAPLFEAWSSCEALGVGKERPEVYLDAARQLGAAPGDCAVFEDALFAARTARTAGFYTVGVYDWYNRSDWPALRALCQEAVEDWRQAD